VGFLIGLLNVLLVICSLFLICLVLIQRGKGGGLAGAFGGPGGSSAFGTKAGDIFTKITIITAGIWIGLSMLLVILINQGGPTSAFRGGAPERRESALPGADLGLGGEGAGGDLTIPPIGRPAAPSGTGKLAPPSNADVGAPSAAEPPPVLPESGATGLPSALGTEPGAPSLPTEPPGTAPEAGK
jgi:preprotein translocase subunit SecG